MIYADLPIPLYKEIKEFLIPFDFNVFLGTSKIFVAVKHELRFLNLTSDSSLEFCTDPEFRSDVLERIHDPKLQLSLCQMKMSDEMLHEFLLHPANSLYLLSALNLHKIPNWQTCLSNRNFIFLQSNLEITTLKGIETVNSLSIDSFYKLTTVGSIYNLKEVRFTSCGSLTDLSSLSGLDKLELINCGMVSDVKSVMAVKFLRFKFCPGITSLIAHPNNERMIIESCSNISKFDFSKKTGYLSTDLITDYEKSCQLINVTAFEVPESQSREYRDDKFFLNQNLNILRIKIPCLISSFHEFKNLSEVFVTGNKEITHLNGLETVRRVSITNCLNLNDISSLGKNQCVYLNNCPSVSTFVALKCIPRVSLTYCNITDLSEVDQVQYLTLHVCSNIRETTCSLQAGRVKHLQLFNCGFPSLKGAKDIPVVEISVCAHAPSFLNELGNNDKIILIYDKTIMPKVPKPKSLKNYDLIPVPTRDIFSYSGYFNYLFLLTAIFLKKP
jgi:hypothetical protein